ncbi:hypothetical protein E4U41_003716 [Claviceps citrina]|nr:hypothetical protein E4U41_003716 [Claviceps citrina]
MAAHVVPMVGVSSFGNRRSNHGTGRQAGLASRTRASAKPGIHRSHGAHGSHGARGPDTSTGSSLKIANWRVRQSDDGSGASVIHVDDELPSCTRPPARPRFSSSSFRASSTRRRSDTGKPASASSHGADALADVEGDGNMVSRASRPQGSSGSGASSFEVVRHSRLLERDDGQTVSLFELSRWSRDSPNSSGSKGEATLRPAPSADCSATVTPDESQREQLLAALYASDAMPGRHAGPSFSSLIDAFRGLSIHGQPSTSLDSGELSRDRTTNKTFGGSGMASSSGVYQEPATSSSHSAGAPSKDQDRFEQLINKLNRKYRPENNPVRTGTGGGCKATEAVAADGQQRHHADSMSTVQHRRPVHGSGRRVNTESDSVMECLAADLGHARSDFSTDVGIPGGSTGGGTGGSHGRGNSLNPKAREFFSFSRADSQATLLARRPVLSFAGWGAPWEDAGPDALAGVGSRNRGSVLASAGSLSAALPSYLGLWPETNARPLGLVPVSGPANQGISQGITEENANGGMMEPSFPLIAPVHSLPRMAYLPMSSGSGGLGLPGPAVVPVAPVPPRPVPKPKSPDAKTQQLYEAWVEYRKAIEPGYAMSCKVRQQRRAQRKTAQHPRPKRFKGTV